MVRVPKSIKTDAEFDTWLSFVQDRGNRAHGTTEKLRSIARRFGLITQIMDSPNGGGNDSRP